MNFLSRQSISKQGLVLLALLFFLELSIIGSLFWQLKEAESRAAKESEIRAVFSSQQKLSRDMYTAFELFSKWKADEDPASANELNAISQSIDTQQNYLQKKLPNQNERAAVERLQESTRQVFSKIFALIKSSNQPGFEPTNELFEFEADSLRGPMDELKTMALSIVRNSGQNPSVQSQDSVKHEQAMQSQMQLAVLSGLLANLILAFYLAAFFAARIEKRVNVILDNTRKFRKGEKLNEALDGNDEIALLDRAFHEMANEMRKHERLRSSYIDLFRHDLSSPLSKVKTQIITLEQKETKNLNKQGGKMLASAVRNLTRLSGLVDSLLESSTIGQHRIKIEVGSCRLKEIIESSAESISEFARSKNIAIECNYTDIELEADGQKLIQVLINFLSNAVKFSPANDSILIKTKISQSTGLEPSLLELSVIDHGRGVPGQMQESIFEKFEQSLEQDGKRGSGTGLGLAICKEIIELHAGSIGVESQEGAGSRFWFRIPLKSAQVR